jgi:1-hydroxycarotenoid 3,4-desaturase
VTRAIVIGGGIGGLVAAIELQRSGVDVQLIEKEREVGGKMRVVEVAGRRIDSGPTVLTMRWVFDELFEACGLRLEDELALVKLDVLARHAWDDGSRLDLFSDPLRSRAAIAELAGESNARGFDGFAAYARRIYEEVEDVFIRSERPSLGGFLTRHGIKRAFGVARIDAHRTMWGALDDFFDDSRLKQLFARYATYSGSSPYDAPATLHLISHVEASGVWIVDGGIHPLALSLRSLLESLGGRVSTGERVREIEIDGQRARAVIADRRYEADAVIVNADAAALASGYFGRAAERAVDAMPPKARSLSAVTWSMVAETSGFPLAHHNVFFSSDSRREFEQIGRGRLPSEPTVYVCAQDRLGGAVTGLERLFVLVNAPARDGALDRTEIDACENRTFDRLARAGLTIRSASHVRTTPADFDRLFPGTGGALYGRATHGMTATLSRPGSRTSVKGLYLAGGSAHPGAGVPMAGLSGKLAAQAVCADLASTTRSPAAATRGGTWMRSVTAASTRSR